MNAGLGWHLLLQGSSWPWDQTHVSCLAGGFFTTEPPRKIIYWIQKMSQALIQYHRIHSSLLFLLICWFPSPAGRNLALLIHHPLLICSNLDHFWIGLYIYMYIYIYIYILNIYINIHTYVCVTLLNLRVLYLSLIIMNVSFIKYMCYICFLPVQAFLLIFFQRSKCSHFNEVWFIDFFFFFHSLRFLCSI